VQALTKVCGMIVLAAAAMVIVFAIIDTSSEASDASARLRRGGDYVESSDPAPIATTVKYKIGGEVGFDVLVLVILGFFGWFLYSSEIQQTGGVIVVILLVIATVVLRVTPVLPMDVGRASAGCFFWGAYVIDDYYPQPMRDVETFPMNETYRFAVTERTTATTAVPNQSVVLNFGNHPELLGKYNSMMGGSQLIGKLAGTRTILDNDNKSMVYSVPHLMVEEVRSIGSSGG